MTKTKRHLRLVEDPTLAPSPSPSAFAPASYTSRFGDTYYLHQGKTKTGKPRYFVARKAGAGALSVMPEGLEFAETLNGVVSVRRKGGRPSVVPAKDLELVRREMARHPRLQHYAADVRKEEIVVYEPEGLLAAIELEDMADLGQELGLRPEDLERQLAARPRRTRYEPVMKFAFGGDPGVYLAHRRRYSGEGGWWTLSCGPLLELLRKYLPLLGTDRFFELL